MTHWTKPEVKPHTSNIVNLYKLNSAKLPLFQFIANNNGLVLIFFSFDIRLVLLFQHILKERKYYKAQGKICIRLSINFQRGMTFSSRVTNFFFFKGDYFCLSFTLHWSEAVSILSQNSFVYVLNTWRLCY